MEKRIERAEEEPNQEQAEDDQPREKDDPILDLAIEYVVNSAYTKFGPGVRQHAPETVFAD